MHEWEKQEKLLEKIESQEIDDCLSYNIFAYEKHEWDNIPSIVPRYMIYLSKYMAGICETCKEVTDRETTWDLRKDMENRDGVVHDLFKSSRNTDLAEKKALTDSVTTLDTKTDGFRSDYDNFAEEATKLDEFTCTETFAGCMDIVLATKGKSEVPLDNTLRPEHVGVHQDNRH